MPTGLLFWIQSGKLLPRTTRYPKNLVSPILEQAHGAETPPHPASFSDGCNFSAGREPNSLRNCAKPLPPNSTNVSPISNLKGADPSQFAPGQMIFSGYDATLGSCVNYFPSGLGRIIKAH